jgi:hypothetical protein
VRIRALCLAAAAAACGSPRTAPNEPTPAATSDARPTEPPPPPRADAVPAPVTLDRDLPALAGRIAELYGAAGDALVAAGTDCTRASAGLTALRDRFADVRDAIARVVADNRVALLEPELDAQRDVIKAALARMKPTLDACKTDAKLDEALEGLAPGG